MIDRKQPQETEFEIAVLGAVIQSGEAYEIVASILNEKAFYVHAHLVIFRAIDALGKKKQPIDVITVVKELKETGYLAEANGALYVHDLMRNVGSAANVESHARLILEAYLKREAIKKAHSIIDNAYNETYDVFDLHQNIRSLDAFFCDQTTGGNQFTHVSKLIQDERKRYDLRAASKGTGVTLGIPSGIRCLDEVTCGWQNGNLIILAARPAMGKTALMLAFAIGAARAGRPVYIPTLEMTPDELVERILVIVSGVDATKYKNGDLDAQESNTADASRVSVRDMGIFIDDTPAITATRLKALCRKFCKEHPGGIIMVDYLQKMKVENNRGKNRENEINEISQELKNIARENKVPVIALSQLSREVEKRGDKRPMLSDLRESGAIEQEADVVLFLHRPGYYDTSDNSGDTEIIVAKYRNGETGIVNTRFIPSCMRFVDPYHSYGIQPNVNFQHESKKNEAPF